MTSHHRFVHVIEAKHLGGHRIRLRFDDGVCGDVDLFAELSGEVFAPLLDVAYFARFQIDQGRTLSWPNGADFAPDFLHELVVRPVAGTAV